MGLSYYSLELSNIKPTAETKNYCTVKYKFHLSPKFNCTSLAVWVCFAGWWWPTQMSQNKQEQQTEEVWDLLYHNHCQHLLKNLLFSAKKIGDLSFFIAFKKKNFLIKTWLSICCLRTQTLMESADQFYWLQAEACCWFSRENSQLHQTHAVVLILVMPALQQQQQQESFQSSSKRSFTTTFRWNDSQSGLLLNSSLKKKKKGQKLVGVSRKTNTALATWQSLWEW